MNIKKIHPPQGMQIGNVNYLDATDESEIRDFAISLVKDKRLVEKLSIMSRDELLNFYQENGFELSE